MIGLRQKAGARWSRRRSGIEGALPFRGGAGDNIEFRLAGTPAGRFAASMQAAPLLQAPACKEWRAGAACSFCPAKSVTARNERKLVRLIGLGVIFGMGLWEYWSARGGSQAARVACRSVADWLPGPVLGCMEETPKVRLPAKN